MFFPELHPKGQVGFSPDFPGLQKHWQGNFEKPKKIAGLVSSRTFGQLSHCEKLWRICAMNKKNKDPSVVTTELQEW